MSSSARDDSFRALWFFRKNPARMGSDSAKIGLRSILSSELAIRINALTTVKRVISFFSLKSKYVLSQMSPINLSLALQNIATNTNVIGLKFDAWKLVFESHIITLLRSILKIYSCKLFVTSNHLLKY
jgi:hypothetical protein